MMNVYLKLQKMSKISYAYFKDESVVFVNVDKTFIKSTNKELKKKLKAEKVSIFKRAEASNMFWEEYGSNFAQMSSEEIAKEHSDIIEINYTDIIKFKLTPFRRNVRIGGGDTEPQDYLGELSIKTENAKTWHNHRYKKDDAKFLAVQEIKNNLFG